MNRIGDCFRLLALLALVGTIWSPGAWGDPPIGAAAVSPSRADDQEQTLDWIESFDHDVLGSAETDAETVDGEPPDTQPDAESHVRPIGNTIDSKHRVESIPQSTTAHTILGSTTTVPVAKLKPQDPAPEPPLEFDETLLAARARVVEAADRLETFLRNGSVENAERWKSFLKWDVLREQLTPGANPDASQLAQPLTQLYRGNMGLEMRRFVHLREALMGYRRLVLYRTNRRNRDRFDQQMREDADTLLARPTRNFGRLASRLAMMEQLGFEREKVQQTRQQYGHANFVLAASANMVNQILAERVSQSEAVHENILGTTVRGVAHLNADLSAQLVPAPDRALIQLQLSGNTDADTVGRRSPVTIYTRSQTHVEAQKLILMDQLRGLFSEPTRAQCVTTSRIKAIRADNRLGKRLIESVAWRKAGEQKHRANQESSRRAQVRIARQMDQQTNERLVVANQRLREQVQRPMQMRDVYPQWISFSTTAKQLIVNARQGRPSQLSAPIPPPAAPTYNTVLQIHETMILNTAVNLIGGLNLTDIRAAELIKEATGDVPDSFTLKQDEDPWSISFDMEQPIAVRFENNQIAISVRGRRFTRGDQVIRQKTDISALYDIQIANGRLRLQRNGDVQVTYPENDKSRLSLTELRNKTFLTSKFESLFKSELGGDEAAFSDRLQDFEQLKKMKLAYVLSHDGWLTLGWN